MYRTINPRQTEIMNIYLYYGWPKCKICGRKMQEWNPFAKEHEHDQCKLKRLALELERDIKKIFKSTK